MTCDKAKTILMDALREHFPGEEPLVVRVKDGALFVSAIKDLNSVFYVQVRVGKAMWEDLVAKGSIRQIAIKLPPLIAEFIAEKNDEVNE